MNSIVLKDHSKMILYTKLWHNPLYISWKANAIEFGGAYSHVSVYRTAARARLFMVWKALGHVPWINLMMYNQDVLYKSTNVTTDHTHNILLRNSVTAATNSCGAPVPELNLSEPNSFPTEYFSKFSTRCPPIRNQAAGCCCQLAYLVWHFVFFFF